MPVFSERKMPFAFVNFLSAILGLACFDLLCSTIQIIHDCDAMRSMHGCFLFQFIIMTSSLSHHQPFTFHMHGATSETFITFFASKSSSRQNLLQRYMRAAGMPVSAIHSCIHNSQHIAWLAGCMTIRPGDIPASKYHYHYQASYLGSHAYRNIYYCWVVLNVLVMQSYSYLINCTTTHLKQRKIASLRLYLYL